LRPHYGLGLLPEHGGQESIHWNPRQQMRHDHAALENNQSPTHRQWEVS
jgi:hypothetical protein